MILYRVLGDVVQISDVFHMRENYHSYFEQKSSQCSSNQRSV